MADDFSESTLRPITPRDDIVWTPSTIVWAVDYLGRFHADLHHLGMRKARMQRRYYHARQLAGGESEPCETVEQYAALKSLPQREQAMMQAQSAYDARKAQILAEVADLLNAQKGK